LTEKELTGRMNLAGKNLKKLFNWRVIFRDVSFEVGAGQTMLVTGRNGSGKSTLVKIISGVLTPTSGTVELHAEETPGERSADPPADPSGRGPRKDSAERWGRGAGEERQQLIGLVSPYLQMYDEFSARENIQLALAIRGRPPENAWVDELLQRVGLFERRDDPVRTYSSGMKQRVKYAFALSHRPPVLLLDEPMANLDAEGAAMVRTVMARQRQGGILVVATNDLSDIDHYDLRVDLNAAP
jgi:heme exporter protein A